MGLLVTLSLVSFLLQAAPVNGSDRYGANLYLTLDSQGTVNAQFSLSQVDAEVDASDLKPTKPPASRSPIQLSSSAIQASLSESLGCPLQAVRSYEHKVSRSLRGTCDRGFARQGSIIRGSLNPTPLLQLLQPLNAELFLSIHHAQAAYSQITGYQERVKSPFGIEQGHFYRFQPGQKQATPIQIEFGYRPIDLAHLLIPIALLLGLPLACTLWFRQIALRGNQQDPAAAWFGYVRALNWMILATWIGWWGVTFTAKPGDWLTFLLGKSFWLGNLEFGLLVLPPGLIVTLCYILSYPVFAQVRGMQWTRLDLAKQAIFSQAAYLLPIHFFFTGIGSLFSGKPLVGISLFLLAYICQILFGYLLAKAEGLQLNELTVGELRDRVFELAEKAGVKLKQLYVLPAGKGQLINAFASQNNTVMLSDYLVQHFSKAEVDAIVAHELGHLKRGHPGRIGTILFTSVFVAVVFTSLLGMWLPQVPWLAVGIVVGLLGYYLMSQQFEHEADSEAIALSGDPEALITGLTKLTRLNRMPLQQGQWSSRLSTHPSTWKRVQAIARLGHISPERLQVLVEGDAAPDQLYALPAPTIDENTIFSTPFKHRYNLTVGWLLILTVVLSPALVAYLVQRLPAIDAVRFVFYVIGLVLSIVLYLVVSSFGSTYSFRELKQRFYRKLEQQGLHPEQGIFVSFSPDGAPRSYEGWINWDIGCLFLMGDRLCYVGEHAQFALRRDQITAIYLGQGYPGWIAHPNAYIAWQDSQQGRCGTFNLRPGEVKSLWQMKPQVRLLKQQLQHWWEQPASSVEFSEPLAHLKTPEIGTVTSVSPASLDISKLLFSTLQLVIGFAIALSLVLQLSWQGSLYVVFVAAFISTAQWIPYWRYREPTS